MSDLAGVQRGPRIAYFSMEIGVENEIPTYAGGLGVLAGDTVRSCADLRLPMVAITLVSKRGYFRQQLSTDGKQTEYPQEWNPASFMKLLPTEVSIKIQSRNVKIRPWLYNVSSITGGSVPVLFLDTDIEGNAMQDREITHYLYGGDNGYRLKQEAVLGIGGFRMLHALGFNIRKYHLNEGHSSLLSIELLHNNGMDIEKARELCIFTTHTPVGSGHDKFEYNVVSEVLMGEGYDLEILKKLGGQDRLNMTLLALNLSNYVNGVAKRHQTISSKMFPGYEIHAITNGIHSYTWTCSSFRALYDKYLPGWANEPYLLVRIDSVPDEEIWQAHMLAKKALIEYISNVRNVTMDNDTLTIGFARRATEYKRTDLIFSNLERLRKANRKGNIQLVFAGKAHPRDIRGKVLIEQIFGYMQELKEEIKMVYLENYDMDLATKMTSGVDVWLNTPLRPLEASGTSGMKAAHNGVINFSILDGWWIEGWIENVTGWAIGPLPDEEAQMDECRIREIDDLYNKLEYLIIPQYYERRDNWIAMMENSIGKLAYYFNSHRMMHRYIAEAYF